jgi:hypothetical protein
LWILGALVVFGTACVPPPDDPIAVNPGAIAKAELSGLWLYRIDVQGNEPPFNAQCLAPLEGIVRWEITYDYLLARLVDPRSPALSTEDASIVGAWEIIHFDVPPMTWEQWCANEYRTGDASSGECRIVFPENTLRPWYVREYIRVLWDRNLAAELELERLTGQAISVEPISSAGSTSFSMEREANGDLVSLGVTNQTLIQRAACASSQAAGSTSHGASSLCDWPWLHTCAPMPLPFQQSFRKPSQEPPPGLVSTKSPHRG